MLDNEGSHNRSDMTRKRWRWLLIPALAVVYMLLGLHEMVPWFDTTSCAGHISKARRAMQAKDNIVATRHIIAAMRRLDRNPQEDRRCWRLLRDELLELCFVEHTYPSATDLNGMIRIGDRNTVVKAWRMKIERFRLERLIQKLGAAAHDTLDQEERAPTNAKPFMLHAKMLINTDRIVERRVDIRSLLLRRHRRLVTLLPPGDQQILDSFYQIDHLSGSLSLTDACLPGEIMQLYASEIQRCEQTKPCPIVALMIMTNRSASYASASQQLVIASRYIGLIDMFLTEQTSSRIPKHRQIFNAGSWLSIYLRQGYDVAAQRQLERIITAACTSLPEKRELASTILTDCARCWSRSGGGDTGWAPYHKQNIQCLRKILAVQERLVPHSLSTALVWAMLGDIYLNQHDEVKAEQCYNQSIDMLNHVCGHDVTRMLCARRMPKGGKYYDLCECINEIYGGYVQLLIRTGRGKIATQICPMLD